MKLESNDKLLGGGGSGEEARRAAEVPEARASADEIIDDILAEFSSAAATRFPNVPARSQAVPLRSPVAPPTRTPSNSLSEGELEDIDPASDLGASIRSKCLELEDILRSLKSRLNRVVLDENIVLSPDANSLEAQLEHDMDTDVQEDLSLQEFLELLGAQEPPSSSATMQ